MDDDVNTPDQAFDISKPSPARMYDALLGGKDNYAADREAAEQLAVKAPEVYEAVRANWAFLVRAVRFLANQGIRQYIDLGSGLPTSPNVHEVAQQVHRDARVAYVDNDPVVAAHGRARLARQTTRIVRADLRHPQTIIDNPDLRELISRREPVAVLAVAVLHFLDDRDGLTLVARLRQVMAPGSWLVVTHASPGTRSVATVSGPTRCPRRLSSSAKLRVDFVVHRSGNCGSPREAGSTSANKAGRNPGSTTSSRLRPPPDRQTRPSGASPDSSSATPAVTVGRLTPAARDTAAIPP